MGSLVLIWHLSVSPLPHVHFPVLPYPYQYEPNSTIHFYLNWNHFWLGHNPPNQHYPMPTLTIMIVPMRNFCLIKLCFQTIVLGLSLFTNFYHQIVTVQSKIWSISSNHLFSIYSLCIKSNSFDVDENGQPNRHLLDSASGGNASGLNLQNMPARRESFLYRSDSEYEISPKSASRHSSIGSGES